MKSVADRICKLLEVKSLVTLALTGAMIAMLFSNKQLPDGLVALFSSAYGATITFFFTRPEKDKKNEE